MRPCRALLPLASLILMALLLLCLEVAGEIVILEDDFKGGYPAKPNPNKWTLLEDRGYVGLESNTVWTYGRGVGLLISKDPFTTDKFRVEVEFNCRDEASFPFQETEVQWMAPD